MELRAVLERVIEHLEDLEVLKCPNTRDISDLVLTDLYGLKLGAAGKSLNSLYSILSKVKFDQVAHFIHILNGLDIVGGEVEFDEVIKASENIADRS